MVRKAKNGQTLMQSDVPSITLEKALRIPSAIVDQYASKAASPVQLGMAIGIQPTSGKFRQLVSASSAYGLTSGGYTADKISLDKIGKKILKPLSENDEFQGKLEAILKPAIQGKFLREYDGQALPSEKIACNVLESMGVPASKSATAYRVIKQNAEYVGVLQKINDKEFIDFDAIPQDADNSSTPSTQTSEPTPYVLTAPSIPQPPVRNIGQQPFIPLPQHPLSRGMQIDAYELLERLGSGFSAEVWSARVVSVPPGVELEVDKIVALKFYKSHALALHDQVLRVEREYRIAQTINHPHLIRIYEFLLASPRPHHNFLVMDLARGKLLKEVIQQRPLSARQGVQLLYQVFSALDELHNQDALHRDVKPANISVEIQGESIHATLLDLGIVTVSYEPSVTAATHFLGSKHWAPMEQLLGEPLDARSDLYSVGAVGFNIFTRTEPYAGSATEAAVAVQMGKSSISIPALKEVPDEVRDVLNSCLSINREHRPATARECMQTLQPFVESERSYLSTSDLDDNQISDDET